MEPLHYVVFHPDSARQELQVEGQAIVDDQPVNWSGRIWVDDENGNEDPFVLTESWLYSYCHATQLRRSPGSDRYLTSGSVLFFCSGDEANHKVLMCGTLFVVDHVALWPTSGNGLPEEFTPHFTNLTSDLWEKHFRFPFEGQHTGKYTYVSKTWEPEDIRYSCLPIGKEGNRVAIPFAQFKEDTRTALAKRVRGKFPVMLSEQQKDEILQKILARTKYRIVSIRTRRAMLKINTQKTCRPCGKSKPHSTC